MAVVKITGLKSSTKYSYVVYAKFADGTRTETSRAITFTTPKSAKPSTIRDEFIQLGGGSIFAGNIDFSTGLLTGPGVSLNQNGILGQQDGGIQTFLLESSTGNAYFAGTVTASIGSIGGWTLGRNIINSSSVGLYAPTTVAMTDVAIYAGSSSANRNTAPFRIMYNGDLIASNASITGNIVATSGSFSGKITATTGQIGGWDIGPTSLSSGILNLSTAGTPKIYAGTGNHGSLDTGFYIDSSGKFSLSNQLIFNPGAGTNSSLLTTGTFTISTTTITVPAGLTIVKGMTVTGTGIDTNTFVTNFSGTTVTISKNTLSSQTNVELNFVLDDFAELQVVGRIKGVIDSTQIVPSPRLQTTISAVVVSGPPSNQTATITTTGHAFLANEKIVIESLPTTNGLNNLNRSFTISSVTDSVTLVIDISGIAGVTSGTNTGLSGTATLQELTMGLHPSEGATTDWEHTQGTGLRLDKFNWWFTNGQLRVGTSGTSFKWNGTTFALQGGGTKQIQLKVGAANSDNLISIVDTGSTPKHNTSYTPFYVDGTGSLSLGNQFVWNGADRLSITGSITAQAGIIGGFTIDSDKLYNWSTSSVTIKSSTTEPAIELIGQTGTFATMQIWSAIKSAYYASFPDPFTPINSPAIAFKKSSDGAFLGGLVANSSGEIAMTGSAANGNLEIGLNNGAVTKPNVYWNAQNTYVNPNLTSNKGSIYINTDSVALNSSNAGIYISPSGQMRIMSNRADDLLTLNRAGAAITGNFKWITFYSNGTEQGYIRPSNTANNIAFYSSGSVSLVGDNSVRLQGSNVLINNDSNGDIVKFQIGQVSQGAISANTTSNFTKFYSATNHLYIETTAAEKNIFINQDADASGTIVSFQTSGTTRGAISHSNTSNSLRLFSSTGKDLILDASDSSRQVKIGNANSGSIILQSNSGAGQVWVPDATQTTTTAVNAVISTSGRILTNAPSLQRVKHNISPLSNNSLLSNKIYQNKISNFDFDYKKVLQLTPVSFDFLPEENIEMSVYQKQIGFIAEDVEDKIPELADYDENGNLRFYKINSIVSAMLAVMQDQQKIIESLEQKIAALENK